VLTHTRENDYEVKARLHFELTQANIYLEIQSSIS